MTPEPRPLHTVFEPAGLAAWVRRTWALRGPVTCRLLVRGVNDTYAVVAGGKRFALRVHPHGWRSGPELEFEAGVLHVADAAGVPVPVVVRTPDGAPYHAVSAPEGPRPAVLFDHAPGVPPSFPPDHGLYAALGELTATLHAALAGARPGGHRRELDAAALVTEPMAALRAHAQPAAAAELEAAAATVAERLATESVGWTRGICHGDIGIGNLHVDAHGAVTLLDFDACGPGWPAYDLAGFRWWTAVHQAGRRPWELFLDGYRSVRPLSTEDEAAVPLLVSARQLWVLGLQARLAASAGSAYLDREAVAAASRLLRAWAPDGAGHGR